MRVKTVAVCDDNPGLAEGWVDQIRAAVPAGVAVLRIENPKDEFKKLLERIPVEAGINTRSGKECIFDKADVVVLDYDLVAIDANNARHTGEGFARMARLYSDCGFIIVMNQFDGNATFDLEMLGHLGSFADLNIDSNIVGTSTLWGGIRDGRNFAPWSWPDFDQLISSREELAKLLATKFDTPLVESIDFPLNHLSELSDRALAFLSSTAKDGEQFGRVTLRDFLAGASEHKELVRAIESNPHRAAAAAVARLSKWYSRAVLGPQDVLVDVPHLLQRMPFLMNPSIGDLREIATWNSAISCGASALIDDIQPARFSASKAWIGVDSFWWPEVAASPIVRELRSKFDPNDYADVVFAEDASVFIPYDEKAIPFRAGFHNQFDVRYLKFFDGVNYGPGRRLAAV